MGREPREMPKALLISTYDLGRQPFGLASPAAWLKAAGWDVVCTDAAKTPVDRALLASVDVIAFHLPMHTATRLAAPIIDEAKRANPSARLCAYGLYARLNEEWLRSRGVDAVFGGEFEEELTRFVSGPFQGRHAEDPHDGSPEPLPLRRRPMQPKLKFLVPDRSGLLPLSRYASLQYPDGRRLVAGYTEASRGCRHLCRHCPIVPVYEGQFRIVQADVVLADIDAQVAAGAQHITFGDPDFFNGPTHALHVVRALHAHHPAVTYDVTIKVEHLLHHRDLLPELAATGCAFVTSAVESIDDGVLALLDKGHTRADFVKAVRLCRDAGVAIAPTFVAFHPWITLDGYCELLETIADLDLVDRVAPIQLAIRLLVPQASRLLEREELRVHLGGFDPGTLSHRWVHPDPRVDALQHEIGAIVGRRVNADRRQVFEEIFALAHARAGRPGALPPLRDRASIPYLNEPWYC